jgi:hypothetical protein
MIPQTTHEQTPVHTLQCLDLWSGNEAICNAISVPGLDV